MKTKDMVIVALFAAIIVVMACVPFLGYIPLGVINATIIHVPVIIASVVLGPKKGAFLGGVFGLTSLINNTLKPNLTSFAFSPFLSVQMAEGDIMLTILYALASLVICFLPRILTGVVPYYVSKLIKKYIRIDIVSYSVAGFAGSFTNTLLVMNLIYIMYKVPYAQARGCDVSALYGAILSIIGINGSIEAACAAILTFIIVKALKAAKI